MAETKTNTFYVTAAIPYVNAPPHIGHALEYVQADVLARWHRLLGEPTFFLMGADENTLKLIQAAKQEGIAPEELADKYTARFIELTTALTLSNDDFIRTTDRTKHHPGAQALWQKLAAADLLYKGQYEGLYCVECEQFYTAKEVVEGKCPVHGRELEQRSEENYLFKLSAFAERLEKVLTDGTYQIFPETRRNEVLAFVRSGLADISFSRPAERLSMGVPVPGDASQTMYVWVDALANYITGIGYGRDEELFRRWWPAELHMIGKDIIRFHAVYWPAMLLGAEVPLPKALYAHGFMTIEGEKMSKSQGNVIDPFELVKQHGTDPVRYYFLATMPYAGDGNYSESHFSEVYDSQLANDLGNLVSRVLAMAGGEAPAGTADPTLKEHVGQTHHEFGVLLDDYKFAEALECLNRLVSAANRFIEEQQPYKLDGQPKADALYTLVQVLGHLSVLYEPFIPATAAELRGRLGIPSENWNRKSLLNWEKVPHGTNLTKGEPLFPKP
jgi:methionyl-tRNA synthetase